MREVSHDCLNAASNSAKFKTDFKHGLKLPPRRSEQVLAVPELLEMVLLHLPAHDVLHLQAVCLTFRDVIALSAEIQKKLHFQLRTGGTVGRKPPSISTTYIRSTLSTLSRDARDLAPSSDTLEDSRFNPLLQRCQGLTIGRYTITLGRYSPDLVQWPGSAAVDYHCRMSVELELNRQPVHNESRLQLYFDTSNEPDSDDLPEGNWKNMWFSDEPIWIDLVACGPTSHLRNKVAVHTMYDLYQSVRLTYEDLQPELSDDQRRLRFLLDWWGYHEGCPCIAKTLPRCTLHRVVTGHGTLRIASSHAFARPAGMPNYLGPSLVDPLGRRCTRLRSVSGLLIDPHPKLRVQWLKQIAASDKVNERLEPATELFKAFLC